MHDPRIGKLAHVLVTYAVGVEPGNLVRVSGSSVTEPLITALYEEVIRAGGHPVVRMIPDACQEILLRFAAEGQLAYLDRLALQEVETIDCSIGVWGNANTRSLSGIEPSRQALASKARKPIVERFLKRAAEKQLRWVGTEFPTQASAQDAGMSLLDFEDFVFRAGLLHLPNPGAAWQEVHERQQRVCDGLESGQELHFRTPSGTDLTVGIAGRHWLNSDGHHNFPDGEVYTGPVEDCTQGTLALTFPAVYEGREAEGVRIVFRDGRAVDASADKGEKYLIQMLDQDPGARVLGEVAFGLNYGVTRFMRNLTFDEKIGGTFHVALGASYPESGGKNESGLHWDMVCDLSKGGTVELDGQCISIDGRFLNPEWPQPDMMTVNSGC